MDACKKLVIVGGVAGGASAAARARRLSETMEITMFERGPYVSFANCGLPYHVGGEIQAREKLLLQTPESFKARFNVDVRVQSEVVAINRDEKTVTVRDGRTGTEYKQPYDALVYSPGASPIVPPIPGLQEQMNKRVFTLRNIPDMDGVLGAMKQPPSKRGIVIGGGFIGMEMAEALVHRGWEATVVEKAPQVMGSVDGEMATYLHDELRSKGVGLRLGTGATSFETTGDGQLKVQLDDGSAVEAAFAVLCIGVRPDVGLAKAAGLELGPLGGVKVDSLMRTNDPCIYAVGDAVETPSTVAPERTLLPALAGPANRQGRAAAGNMLGRELAYGSSQCTAICKIFGVNIGSVGASERQLQRWGWTAEQYQTVFLHAPNHAGYYPGATMLHMKLIFSRPEGKILGAQIAGQDGVDKRIDVLAVAQRAGMTVHDLQHLELSYAPPFNGAKDIVNQAGFVAVNILTGLVTPCHAADLRDATDRQVVLDVRTAEEVATGRVPRSVHIPVDELRQRLGELPKDKEVLVYCKSGVRSHVATMMLTHHGFKVRNMTGGYLSWLAESAAAKL